MQRDLNQHDFGIWITKSRRGEKSSSKEKTDLKSTDIQAYRNFVDELMSFRRGVRTTRDE